MQPCPVAGIDLGTTYSSLAIVDDQGTPSIVPNAETERLTPSAVLFDEEAIYVGQIAKDALMTNPDEVVMFAKRQMGIASWYVTHENKKYTASDISGMILTKLKKDAEAYLGKPLTHVVITVPAYFDDDRRRGTIAAGESAGFQVLDLLNEPTAAAIAFGVDRSKQAETVLVYDLGGGTLDVTIMNVDGKQIKIIATDGAHQLGGKDFDDAIMRYAVECFVNEHGFDPTLDSFVAGDLRTQAEKTKRELSKRPKAMIMLRAQGKSTRIDLEREKFSSLIKPKLDETLAIVKDVLQTAHMSPASIDRILLIGGSTRVPAVREMLAQFFCKEPDSSVNPDEAVALGAALVATQKYLQLKPEEVPAPVAEKVGGLQITDVTSHSVGIEAYVQGTNQKINSILIPRNSPVPADQSREYRTTIPGQTAIKVTIYQGEFQDPKLCNPVGEFTLSGLPPNRPAGCKVRITVSCGTNGVISVTALDIESGKNTTTEVSYKLDSAQSAMGAKKRWQSEKPIL